MSRFEIRETVAGDREGVERGLAASGVDEDTATAAVDEAFGGTGPTGLAAVDPSGRIVAHIGVVRIPMSVRGEDRTFGRFTACFVDPVHRLGGLHSLLTAVIDAFESRFESQSGLALVHGRFAELDGWFLRHLFGFEAISTGIVFEKRPAAEPAPASPAGSASSAPGLPLGEALAIEAGPCAPRRDAALLRARCGGGRVFFTARRDGKPTGYAVLLPSVTVWNLVDWAVSDGDAASAHALLAAAGKAAGGLPLRAPFWNPTPWTCHVFQEAGFRVLPSDGPTLWARLADRSLRRHWLSVHWQATCADVGRSDLPPLTADEEPTRPPQPGTVPERHRGAEES